MADVLSPNPLISKPTDALVEKNPYSEKLFKAAESKGELAQKEAKLKSETGLMEAEAEATAAKKFAEERQPKELKEKYEQAVEEVGKPFIPTKETAGDLGLMFALTNIIGFAIGGGAKGNAQAALAAQNGMLEGHLKGQQDVYKREKEVFEENQKVLGRTIEGLRDELKRAAETASVNKDAGLADARQAIAKYQAKQMGEYLEKNGPAFTYELMQKLSDNWDKVQEKYIQEKDRAARLGIEQQRLTLEKERQNKADYEYVVKDGKTYAVNKKDYKDIHEVTGVDFTGATKLGATQKGAGGTASISQGVLKQDVDNAIYNLQTLKNVADKDGKVPGGSVAFANSFKGDLTSDIIRYATTQNVDKGLQGNDAILLNLAYDIASAQTGGRGQLSDAKVKAVVAQMPLDSEPEEVRATKWDAIIHRIESANQTLPIEKQISIPEEIKAFASGGVKTSEKQSDKDEVTGLPKKNSKGWVLHHDKDGNYAYVSPKGEVEEVQ